MERKPRGIESNVLNSQIKVFEGGLGETFFKALAVLEE